MKRKNNENDEDLNRWMVSYADFITLLFAFFVVLFSMSKVNEEKYKHLSEAMSGIFDSPSKSGEPIKLFDLFKPLLDPEVPEQGSTQQQAHVSKPSGAFAFDVGKLKENIDEQIDKNFNHFKQNAQIAVETSPHWVEITLNDEVLFDSGTALVSEQADQLLMSIANAIREAQVPVMVEGHTDSRPIKNGGAFEDNWELSGARAGAVARYLMYGGIEPRLLSAIGYSEYRPIAGNDDVLGRQMNRRVKIIIGDIFKRQQAVLE